MEENPLISIILPVYNGEKYLKQAIESCLNQSYKNFELIIVDDCSKDASLSIAENFTKKDNRIVVFSNKVNKKLPVTLNIGHNFAKGDYITWTSDDNLLKFNFLETLVKTIKENQVDVVYSNYDIINENGDLKRIHQTGPVEHLFFGNKIGASFLYKKIVFSNLSGYDESLYLLEDYDFWLRASARFQFFHLKDNLYQYRLHSNSLTSKVNNNKFVKEKHEEAVLKMLNKFSEQFSWDTITLKFLIDNLLKNKIDIFKYIQTKSLIEKDLMKFNLKVFNKQKIVYGMQLIVRNELITNNCNGKTLLKVLKKERALLFHSSFSKKQTFHYFLKSIFK